MYLVDGRRYAAGEHGLDGALAAAYERRVRPLCLCSEPPVPVYVARMGGTFVLKRMPFTGGQHAVGCPHYEPPAELSGLSDVWGSAISKDPDTGLTRLRVDFAMSEGTPRTAGSGGGHGSGSVRGGARLSLHGLLLFLWREAELTKWRPGFEGKRSWAVVRSHLLAAASNKVLNGLQLAEALYIPEAFAVADAEAIRNRRGQCFDRGLWRKGQVHSKMILIGELKEIVPTRLHFHVVIKHVPDMPFLLKADLHRTMTRHFENEFALWTGSVDARIVIAATFALADWGQPVIDELCLVPTSAQWLPVDDGFEKQLIDRLVSERRAFDKVFGLDSRWSSCSIAAILQDGLQAPVTLALDRAPGEELDSVVIAGPASTTWQWRVHATELPALPC